MRVRMILHEPVREEMFPSPVPQRYLSVDLDEPLFTRAVFLVHPG